jgi:hypothetical protein
MQFYIEKNIEISLNGKNRLISSWNWLTFEYLQVSD